MAESVVVLEIYNLALGHIGQEPISAPTSSPACQLYYPSVRDKLLSWAPWTFATIRQALALLGEAPPDTEFAYQYALPTQPEVLRILSIDTQHFAYRREVYVPVATPDAQRAVILTNAPSVVLRYIGRVNEALFPPLFVDTLGLWLGVAICQRMTGKSSIRQQLASELTVQLTRLMDIDAHQDTPRRALNETYIAVRESTSGDSLYPALGDFEESL